MATGTSGEKRDDELTDHNGDGVSTEAAAANADTRVNEDAGVNEDTGVNEDADATDDSGRPSVVQSGAGAHAAADDGAVVDADADADADDAVEDADDEKAVLAVAGKKHSDGREKKGKTVSRREGEEKARKKAKAEAGSPISRFFGEVMAELKKVVTPTRKELWRYVGVVLAFLVIVMLLVALFDFVFNYASSWVFGTGSELFSQGLFTEPLAPGSRA